MLQQNYQQSMTLPANGEVRPVEGHYDETWYVMPHEGNMPQSGNWNGAAAPVIYDTSTVGMGNGTFMRPDGAEMQPSSGAMMPSPANFLT